MLVRYPQLFYVLFALFAVWLPFNSLYDTVAYFEGTVGDKTYAQTPIYFKLFKDFFLLVVIFISIERMIRWYFNQRLVSFMIFLLFAFCFAAAAIMKSDILAIIFGFRSYLVVFFVFAGFYVHQFDPTEVYPWLRFVFWIELTIQILQFFFAPNYYGYTLGSFNLTNPGTFLIPSTMASFALLIHYYSMKRGSYVTAVLCVLSIVLAQSSTGLLILIFYYAIIAIRSIRLSFGVVAIGCVILGMIVYINLDTITGRPEIINNVFTRISIFSEHLSHPLGKGFGLGSGASVLSHVEDATIADSTINSLLINFGWMGLVVYAYFVIVSFRYFEVTNLLFVAFVLFSLTMIIFEMTPFIQFYFFELGRRIANSQNESHAVIGST